MPSYLVIIMQETMQAGGESSWGRAGTKEKLELFQYRDGDRDRDRDRDSTYNDII